MKKVIRILICALAVCLLASSCTKTTLNSILIGGKWELVHILTYDDANYATPIDTWNPAQDGLRIYYEFMDDRSITYSEISTLGQGGTTITGTWAVDGSSLVVRFPRNATTYHIDTANLTDLILFLDYTDAQTGKKYHEVTTLKKY